MVEDMTWDVVVNEETINGARNAKLALERRTATDSKSKRNYMSGCPPINVSLSIIVGILSILF